MPRWVLLAVAVTAGPLLALPGCGLGVRRQVDREPLLIPGVNTRTYPELSHRVALATLEAMREELASADFAKGKENAFASAQGDIKSHLKPGQKLPELPKAGETLPAGFPYFWVEWSVKKGARKERQLVYLVSCEFEGKTRSGEPVKASVKNQPGETLVTMQVGQLADQVATRLLLDKIKERLARPLHPPGSPEEAETFVAFFSGSESRDAIPSLRKGGPSKK